MKSWKVINSLANLVLSIVLLGSICSGQEKGNFEANLQTALDLVVAQKNETENAIRQVRKNPDQANSRQFIPGYMDMSDAFNKAIETVKSGDATAVSTTQNEIGHDVRLNRVWMERINEIFSGKFKPIDEPAVTEAWKTILQSSQTLDKKGKKKLSKYLEKKAKWKTWTEL